jgi:hypothetical protein
MPRRSKPQSEPISAHFPDAIRVGVLACDEGYELRLEAHFMHCEVCREPALRLVRMLGECAELEKVKKEIPCCRARNAIFRYFEQGRELTQEAIDHLNTCEDCYDHFIEPARCVRCDEEDADIPALG